MSEEGEEEEVVTVEDDRADPTYSLYVTGNKNQGDIECGHKKQFMCECELACDLFFEPQTQNSLWPDCSHLIAFELTCNSSRIQLLCVDTLMYIYEFSSSLCIDVMSAWQSNKTPVAPILLSTKLMSGGKNHDGGITKQWRDSHWHWWIAWIIKITIKTMAPLDQLLWSNLSTEWLGIWMVGVWRLLWGYFRYHT